MNIALMSHDNKKELMVQFCTAYAGILSHHNIYATNTTGHMVADATGLNVHCFLSYAHGGSQQIGARIAYNEIDMVLFFSDPQSNDLDADLKYITTLCDQYNIPFATNVATAEILIHGLERGDLDWRDIINPKTKPFTAQLGGSRLTFSPGLGMINYKKRNTKCVEVLDDEKRKQAGFVHWLCGCGGCCSGGSIGPAALFGQEKG